MKVYMIFKTKTQIVPGDLRNGWTYSDGTFTGKKFMLQTKATFNFVKKNLGA